MADQNVNIQIFDKEGNPLPGSSVPPGSTSPPNPHATPPGPDTQDESWEEGGGGKKRKRRKQQDEAPAPGDESDPLAAIGSIYDTLSSSVAPIAEGIAGRPIVSAVGATINAGRQIYRSARDISKILSNPPPAPGGVTPPATNGPVPPVASIPAGAVPAGAAGEAAGAAAPVVGAAGAAAPAVAGGAGGAGTGAAGTAAGAAGSAAGSLGAAGPIGIAVALAVAATIGAITALTVAFIYAKDKILEAANDVKMFHSGLTLASTEKNLQELFDRMNRADRIGDTTQETIRLQTQMNHNLYEIWTVIIRQVTPTINNILETALVFVKFSHKFYELSDKATTISRSYMNRAMEVRDRWLPIFPLIRRALTRFLEDEPTEETALLAGIRKSLEENRADAIRNKGIPTNKGLGL